MQIFSLIFALSPLRNIALRDRAFRNEYAIDHPQSNVTFPSFCQAHVRGATTSLERTTALSSHFMNDHPQKS